MSTLLLRLAAPLQAWGVGAKFDRRETQRLPTKSGVIGLLAASLGRRREDDLSDLVSLRMGVRADQAGELLRDYHTARTKTQTYVTQRYYLADAIFLVGLEGEDSLLLSLEHALRQPAFPLFLGRRSCPPQGRVLLGIRDGKGLLDALKEEPWQASPWYRSQQKGVPRLQTLLEVEPQTPGAFFLQDVPESFSQAHRKHGFRSLLVKDILLSDQKNQAMKAGTDVTAHDAMMDWGD